MSLPKGFLFSGIEAGIKAEPRKDLGLIVCETDAVVGGVFTQNKFPSAHVQYCRQLVPSTRFRALIVNSGNANAATGQGGLKANLKMASLIADKLDIDSTQVLTSSTGIIGKPFPIEKIEANADRLISELKPDVQEVSDAILTTDTKKKVASVEFTIDGIRYSAVGFAKGSGMIHPNMATMLAFLVTDAPIASTEVQKLTRNIADKSFNCVSVDGDTSTNDSFFLISSNPVDAVGEKSANTIETQLTQVAISLAKQIAGDGEGAEHLVEASVQGAPTEAVAKSVLNAVLTSNLIKTAIHGKDPNWGRILMAVGNGLKDHQLTDNLPMSISFQNTIVFQKGEPIEFDEEALSKSLNEFQVNVLVDLHSGGAAATGWGCDLSSEYVHINADYST